MKKVFAVGILCMMLLLTGCGKNSKDDVLKNFLKNVNDANGYEIKGELDILNNDDVYHYDVNVSYKKKDNYKVSLRNTANNHEQIILKNSEGVYVLTPSLNKSFKFQSDWPYNNSQIYLLQSLVNDLKADNNKEFTAKENGTYEFVSKVNYPNNRKLVKQKVTLDKDKLPIKVEVMDDTSIPQMTMKFNSINMKPKFDDNHFDLDTIMKTAIIDETSQPMGSLDDIVYPLYIPAGTKLTNQDKVSKTDGERIIMTFDGEKPFLLVEETVSKEDELTIIPTYGEPYMLIDTVGAITDSSITWSSNGIEYYLASDVMSQVELLEIAKSISVLPTMK